VEGKDPAPRSLIIAPDRTPGPLSTLAQRTLDSIATVDLSPASQPCASCGHDANEHTSLVGACRHTTLLTVRLQVVHHCECPFYVPVSDPFLNNELAVRRALHHLIDDSLASIYALIFSVAGPRNYYVQCVLDEAGLLVEAVSDYYVDYGDGPLSREQHDALARLGWGTPKTGENYQQYFVAPVSVPVVADLILTTLREVYGLGRVEDLEIGEVES
jgi:hypothetical protein